MLLDCAQTKYKLDLKCNRNFLNVMALRLCLALLKRNRSCGVKRVGLRLFLHLALVPPLANGAWAPDALWETALFITAGLVQPLLDHQTHTYPKLCQEQASKALKAALAVAAL